MEHVENHSYRRVAIAIVDWPRTIIRLWFLCDDLSNLCLMRMADISINLCYDNVNIYSLVYYVHPLGCNIFAQESNSSSSRINSGDGGRFFVPRHTNWTRWGSRGGKSRCCIALLFGEEEALAMNCCRLRRLCSCPRDGSLNKFIGKPWLTA